MSTFVEFINTTSETLAIKLVTPEAEFHVMGAWSQCEARQATWKSSL